MSDQAEEERRIIGSVGVRIEEVEEEAIDAEHRFVGNSVGRRPAPVERQILWPAYGINDARGARKTRPAIIDEVADGVLAALRPATKDGVVLIDDMVNLDHEILLLFAFNRRERIACEVQAVT